MSEQHFSPSTRREHYVKAIEVLKEGPYAYGLCSILGEITYERGYTAAPWIFFKPCKGSPGLVDYYPELEEPDDIGTREYKSAIRHRIKILKNAIKVIDNAKV